MVGSTPTRFRQVAQSPSRSTSCDHRRSFIPRFVSELSVRKSNARNPASIFKLIKPVYVDDRRFAIAFAGRSFTKPQIARYILIGLNNQMEADRAKGAVGEAVSLEHILPKNPDRGWAGALPRGADPDDWVDLIGNLTLLEKPANRGLGNKDFAVKLAKGYVPSQLAINTDVAAQPSWQSRAIEARCRSLAVIASKVWKLDY
jgi:hypothetical protein